MKPVPRAVRSRASWQRREHACQPSEGEGNALFHRLEDAANSEKN